MSEVNTAIGLEALVSQRNSLLFYAEHISDLTGDAGWHGLAQCAIPKASEDVCLLAEGHGDKLIGDTCAALRTLSTLAEGYASHNNPLTDDDPMHALAGISVLVRLLIDTLEIGRDLQFHAANSIARQYGINAAEKQL